MAASIGFIQYEFSDLQIAVRIAAGFLFALVVNVLLINAQISADTGGKTLVIDDYPGQEVLAYGKDIIVRKRAKGVLAIGGNITIEGSVEGDVAAIGGSVIQRDGAFIGGDVFVLGGKYLPDTTTPLRTEGKETVMYAGYEDELRDLTQNPSQILSPTLSLTFLAQRALSLLFWFVVSMGLATLAPGAVSRAIARFNLSTLKIFAVGVCGLIITTVGVIGSLGFLPDFLSAILGLMAFVLLMLAYVFGRVALHLSVGQFLQKKFFAESGRSETLAIFLGVLAWTLFLSIPYVWPLAVVALFSAGVGLVLTARSGSNWKSV